MSEHDAVIALEKPYQPSTSKHECAAATSGQVASRPQSPSPSNTEKDTASGSGSKGKSSSKHGPALEFTLQSLQSRAQGLIDKINEERSKDQELMKGFNESLSMKVSEISQRLEDRMYNLYDQHNQLLQARMQELPEVIERIDVTHSELQAVCETVINLYRKLNMHPENSNAKDFSAKP